MLSQEAFKRITLWMGVLIILGIIGIAIYMFINVQEIKLLNSNVCELCQEWTGAQCIKLGI
jgi:hypothetical protein